MVQRIAANVVLIWIAIGFVLWLCGPISVTPARLVGAMLLAIPFAYLLDVKWAAQRQRRLLREARRNSNAQD